VTATAPTTPALVCFTFKGSLGNRPRVSILRVGASMIGHPLNTVLRRSRRLPSTSI